jgi:hypothetical protein
MTAEPTSSRRDLVEIDGEVWQLKDGNVQGEFALVSASGERLRLVGVRRAADLFGLEPADVRRWVEAGRVLAVDLDGVLLVRVQLSDTGHLTLLGG